MHLYTIIYITQLTMMIYPRGCTTPRPPTITLHKTTNRLPAGTESGNGKTTYTWTGHDGFQRDGSSSSGTGRLRLFKRHGAVSLQSRASNPTSCALPWCKCWFVAALLGTLWHNDGGNAMLGSSQGSGGLFSGIHRPRSSKRHGDASRQCRAFTPPLCKSPWCKCWFAAALPGT